MQPLSHREQAFPSNLIQNRFETRRIEMEYDIYIEPLEIATTALGHFEKCSALPRDRHDLTPLSKSV
jgi:hypothetical protein